MASLLSKFRIDYASLTMVHDISDKPSDESIKFFDELLEGFREGQNKEGKSILLNKIASFFSCIKYSGSIPFFHPIQFMQFTRHIEWEQDCHASYQKRNIIRNLKISV